jgi:adenosylcobinamide-GDP ribazoletransferase
MRALLVAVAFLTRLPVRAGDVQEVELARSVGFFPVIGLVLGAVMAGAQVLSGPVLGSPLTAALLVALSALLTGALHLDGLADFFDGLGGGRGDPTRILAIMRDSRIGAHGAVALVIVLAGKLIASADLVQAHAAWAILTAPIAARWMVVMLIAGARYAREQGLGKPFTEHVRALDAAWATLLALLCLSVVGRDVLYPTLCAILAMTAVGAFARHKLGGLTGDIYGAAIELGELAFLVASSAQERVLAHAVTGP